MAKPSWGGPSDKFFGLGVEPGFGLAEEPVGNDLVEGDLRLNQPQGVEDLVLANWCFSGIVSR